MLRVKKGRGKKLPQKGSRKTCNENPIDCRPDFKPERISKKQRCGKGPPCKGRGKKNWNFPEHGQDLVGNG